MQIDYIKLTEMDESVKSPEIGIQILTIEESGRSSSNKVPASVVGDTFATK